jgi:hypothetical protein
VQAQAWFSSPFSVFFRAGMLFGLPLDPGIISRAIVLASMLVGVAAAGITIVTATSTLGWLAGRTLEGPVVVKSAKVV